MADNYLENQYEQYRARKAAWEKAKNGHRTFATGVIPGRHDDRDESEDLP